MSQSELKMHDQTRNLKSRTYRQIVITELWQRIKHEKLLIAILILAAIYVISSIIISNCCPIECDKCFANWGNAINELFKNVCYSIIAGITFYLINDIYKNALKAVKTYDEMFPVLYRMHDDVLKLVQNIIGDRYDKSMNREKLYSTIMSCLCNEDDEFHMIGTFSKNRHLLKEDIAYTIVKEKDFNKDRLIFLEVYGDMLTKDEKFSLNRFGDSLDADVVRSVEILLAKTNQEYIDIIDVDISTIIRWLVNYKCYLKDLSKKYIKFAYTPIHLSRSYISDDII